MLLLLIATLIEAVFNSESPDEIEFAIKHGSFAPGTTPVRQYTIQHTRQRVEWRHKRQKIGNISPPSLCHLWKRCFFFLQQAARYVDEGNCSFIISSDVKFEICNNCVTFLIYYHLFLIKLVYGFNHLSQIKKIKQFCKYLIDALNALRITKIILFSEIL